MKDGKLVADHVRHGEIELFPTGRDQFGSSTWFMRQVSFTRDASGRVDGMRAGGGGVAGIRFAKK